MIVLFCGNLPGYGRAGGTGSGPFAITTVLLVWLVRTVFRPIEQTRIPKARAIAPSFLDIVASEGMNLRRDTLSLMRIVSSGTHYDLVTKSAMKKHSRLSPCIRMAYGSAVPDGSKVAYRFSWQQRYEGPSALVRKYYL